MIKFGGAGAGVEFYLDLWSIKYHKISLILIFQDILSIRWFDLFTENKLLNAEAIEEEIIGPLYASIILNNIVTLRQFKKYFVPLLSFSEGFKWISGCQISIRFG